MKKPCTTCEYNKRFHIKTNGWGRNASWMRCTLGMEVDYGYGLDYKMRVQKCAKYREWLEQFKEKRKRKKMAKGNDSTSGRLDKDKLTWKDVQRIVRIANRLCNSLEYDKIEKMGEEGYYTEILEQFNKEKYGNTQK